MGVITYLRLLIFLLPPTIWSLPLFPISLLIFSTPTPIPFSLPVPTVLYNRNPKKLPPTKKLFQSHANMLWDAMLSSFWKALPSPHPHIFLEVVSLSQEDLNNLCLYIHSMTYLYPSRRLILVQVAIGAPRTPCAINFVHICLLNQMMTGWVPSTSSVWAVWHWGLLNLYLLGKN